jgi:folylpolyglutamate synthase/dihydrofolate synthase
MPAASGTQSSSTFSLDRMRGLLSMMGDPQRRFRAVHVAGSKGKGSTASIIAEVLHESGYKCGLYTSPHMNHISERIAVSSGDHLSPITRDSFDELVKRHSEVIAPPFSHFEAITALAFRHYADHGVDIAVVETGMGGLVDATNVIESDHLDLAVLTSIGLEHVQALGGSITSIAEAKAGIIKPGRPVVVGRQSHDEAVKVIEDRAMSMSCEIIFATQGNIKVEATGIIDLDGVSRDTDGRVRSVAKEKIAIRGFEGDDSLVCAPSSFIGPHQHDNITTALTALRKMKAMGRDKISLDSIRRGIVRAFLPGRFQVLRTTDDGIITVLDGAHTQDSARALASTLNSLFPPLDASGPPLPLVLVLAMAADKEHAQVIDELHRELQPVAAVFTSVDIAGSRERSCAPGALAAHWQAAAMSSSGSGRRRPRCRTLIQASLPSAIEKARHELSAHASSSRLKGQAVKGIVLVTGSLHAAGAAEKCLRDEGLIL